jgi:hypothetical protein
MRRSAVSWSSGCSRRLSRTPAPVRAHLLPSIRRRAGLTKDADSDGSGRRHHVAESRLHHDSARNASGGSRHWDHANEAGRDLRRHRLLAGRTRLCHQDGRCPVVYCPWVASAFFHKRTVTTEVDRTGVTFRQSGKIETTREGEGGADWGLQIPPRRCGARCRSDRRVSGSRPTTAGSSPHSQRGRAPACTQDTRLVNITTRHIPRR